MIIALEEHYFDPDWNNAFDPVHHAARPRNAFMQRMEDLGAARIKEMDEAGIDLQVISHGPPVRKACGRTQRRLGPRRRTTACMPRSRRIRPVSPALRRCRRIIRKQPPTNWRAPWRCSD